MHWPWISRTAYVDLRDERDRLLALVERLSEHRIRMERKEAGLPEAPQPQKPKVELPQDVIDLCLQWGDPQKKMREAMTDLARGLPLDEVRANLMPEGE